MAARASRRESMATVRINDEGEVEDVNEEEEPVSLARRLLLGKLDLALAYCIAAGHEQLYYSQRGEYLQHQRSMGLCCHCGRYSSL